MGDTEIKKDAENQNELQKSEKNTKTDKKNGSFFKALKTEFKRIVWPDKDTIVKETTAVVVVTVILGVIIALLDFVIKTGLDKIIQIG